MVSKNIFDLDRWKTLIVQFLKLLRPLILVNLLRPLILVKRLRSFISRILRLLQYTSKPHTNGCGDFTLLSRRGWETLRGYPEWPIFSWHIDSVFLHQAIISKFREKNFASRKPIYHIEHGVGSGFTPESRTLFDRLESANIPYLSNHELDEQVTALKKAKKRSATLFYNNEDWGMIDRELEEVFV